MALAAKALAQFKREHDVLEFKGGLMSGETLRVDQLMALSRLPAREVLHAQLVGVVASPITGLVRGLNALIAGLAIQLQQIVEQGLLPAGEAPHERREEPAAEEPSAAEEPAPRRRRRGGARRRAGRRGDRAPTDGAPAGGTSLTAETEAPSEGEDEKEG